MRFLRFLCVRLSKLNTTLRMVCPAVMLVIIVDVVLFTSCVLRLLSSANLDFLLRIITYIADIHIHFSFHLPT